MSSTLTPLLMQPVIPNSGPIYIQIKWEQPGPHDSMRDSRQPVIRSSPSAVMGKYRNGQFMRHGMAQI